MGTRGALYLGIIIPFSVHKEALVSLLCESFMTVKYSFSMYVGVCNVLMYLIYILTFLMYLFGIKILLIDLKLHYINVKFNKYLTFSLIFSNENDIIIFNFFSLWCRGKARRWLPPLNTQSPQNMEDSGKRMRKTTWKKNLKKIEKE